MRYDHIMLDLETLGVTADSVILSIGAVKFNTDGGIDNTGFYAVCSTDQPRRHINPDTLTWWMKQSPEAQSVFSAPNKHMLEDALIELEAWVDHPKYMLWSNGADFDIPMVNHALKEHGMSPLTDFWNHRCFRTMKSLYKNVPQPAREGTHHNALDDAEHQAKWLQAIYAYIANPTTAVREKGFGAEKKK